ncbi:MAG: FAD-binding protein [Oribacterium sp.]|nr:FAD-binding protein [Oribacterium sp.]MBP3806733.1 FAD-binding protein [Oribacterium sp.]
MKNLSRRDFIKGSLAAVATFGLAATTGCGQNDVPEGTTAAPETGAAEKPTATGVSAGSINFEDTVSWNAEYDAVVVGFGSAGGIASIDLADAGLNVALIEKAPYGHEGGNTRYSSQRFLVVDPKDKDKMITYMKNVRGLYENFSDETIEFLVDGFTKTLEYYEYMGATNYELKNDPEFPAFEGSDIVTKCYTMNNGGKGFWPVIRNAVVERADHIHVWYGTPVTKLIQDPYTKAILGVAVEKDGNVYNVRAKKGVILACGGFEANNRMVEDYLQLPYAIPLGSPYNTGDGITMAQVAGANLWHMSALSGPFLEFRNPETTIPFRQLMGTLSYSTMKDTSAIFVGADGTRFVNETVGLKHGHVMFHGMYIRVPVSLPAHIVFDEAARLQKPFYRVWSEGMEKELEKGWIVKADTLEELAEKIGVPAENLVAEIDKYNGFCKDGEDKDFGRKGEYLHEFGAGPYYAFEVVPAMINTQGGPERNLNCEVLDTAGNPIPNLYSAGELGSYYSSIYQGAGNLGECIITGRKAAEMVVNNDGIVEAAVIAAAAPGETVDFTMIDKEFETGENEYLGIGYGINRIVVKVKMNGDAIENISFLEVNETLGICDGALMEVPQAIISANSTEGIDAVSGATRTTTGIIDAVNDALSKVK